ITVSNAGSRGDLFESSLAAIDEKKIGHRVMTDPWLTESVVVDASRDCDPCLPEAVGDPGFLTGVPECAVPIVVEKPTGHGRINLRNAIVTPAILVDSAGLVQLFTEIREPPYEEVEMAIIVIVEPDGARSPSRRSHSRLFGDIRESAIAVV